LDTRRVVYGTDRRAMLTHSPEYHESHALGLRPPNPAQAPRKRNHLAAKRTARDSPRPRGNPRRPRGKAEAEITAIPRKPWVRRVVTWQLPGERPKAL